jgi:hypothetical protein
MVHGGAAVSVRSVYGIFLIWDTKIYTFFFNLRAKFHFHWPPYPRKPIAVPGTFSHLLSAPNLLDARKVTEFVIGLRNSSSIGEPVIVLPSFL